MGKKGKAQGRAGQKKKAQKAASASSSPWNPAFARRQTNLWDDSEDEQPGKQFRGFAQNSPRPFSARDPLVKLRHQTISFVSAGSNTPATEVTEEEEDVIVVLDDDGDDDDGIAGTDDTMHQTMPMTPQMSISTTPCVPRNALAQMTLQDVSSIPHSNAAAEPLKLDNTQEKDVSQRHDQGIPDERLFMVDMVGDSSIGLNDTDRAMEKGQPIADEMLFVVDTAGDVALAPTLPGSDHIQPTARHARTKSTSSSEEVVVFRGRNQPRIIEDSILVKAPPPKPSQIQPSHRLNFEDTATLSQPTADVAPLDVDTPKATSSINDIAISRDEVKEILSQERLDRDKTKEGDVLSLKVPDGKSNRKGKRGRKRNNRDLRKAVWLDVDEEDDEDDEAAYDDYMANLLAQLDADDQGQPSVFDMKRLSGPSMVVDGREYGDDEILDDVQVEDTDEDSDDDSDLGGERTAGSNDDDLDDMAIELNLQYTSSEMDSSELEDEIAYNEQEQWEDEEDLRQRRIAGMQDEQIARLLAKQQELGISGDELIIDDGFYLSEEIVEGVGDVDVAQAGLDSLAVSAFAKSSKRNTPKRRGHGGFSFPSATLLADTVDQYGEAGFDIMDLDRPSLRTRKKGRKGKLPPEVEALSDDDLKQTLADQWDKDRDRKRAKKVEREELRQQGLLGSAGRKGKADLSQKYLEGMNTKQVMEEIRIFLQDDDMNSRPFPPMDKRDRKKLHEVASAFNLQSKSVGSGANRFPVLYKTKLTIEYDETHFHRVAAASSRGFLKVTGRKTIPFKKNRGGQGGGFDGSSATVRHGEVVGAHAAEISQDSFGHKLMEKMGWTRGTALGKDGEGMLVPIAQVMRSGKAGLG